MDDRDALVRRHFTDVLLVPTTSAGTTDDWTSHPPAGDPPVNLGKGIWLEHLDDPETFMLACEARGENFNPKRQFGQRYSFIRRDAPGDACNWDADTSMHAIVALSRLILSNAYSTTYAARIEEASGSRPREVVPVHEPTRFEAWVPAPTRRDWLDHEEALALAALAARYWKSGGTLPRRISNALWLCEYGYRIYWADVRWPHTVTALEALLSTDRKNLRAQFVKRSTAMAAEFGLTGFDEHFAHRAYTARSEAVHGSRVRFEDNSKAANELDLLETLLRCALRKAIEDEQFRSSFTDEGVRQRWPV